MLSLVTLPERHTEKWKKMLPGGLLIFMTLTAYAVPVQAVYEQPPVLKAKTILNPALFKSGNYTIQDQVKNDGFFNHYTVNTSFGTFKAGSTSGLEILLNEINAITDMKKIDTSDTATSALKQSGANTVAGVKKLFSEPQETLEGAAAGVSSLFNRAKNTVGKRKSTDAEDSRIEQLVGISKSKGKIASKYGVNVYSRNKILQVELDRLGRADFLGGLGVGVATSVVPGVGGLVLGASGTARLLNDAINTTPASELWLQNKNKLIAMGMDADTVELFLNNPAFSPALSTVLVASLESMKGVENRELFIKVALQAADPVMAGIIVKTSIMTAAYHKNVAQLMRLSPMARLTQTVRKDGTRVVVLPSDHMIWSQRVAEAITTMGADEKEGSNELWITGKLSKLASEEFKKRSWKVHTEAGSKLFPDRK